MLREGGTFVAKFFKMADLSYLYAMMKAVFRDVYVVKPESSRSSSAEAFVVGIGFREGENLSILSESLTALKPKEQEQEAESEDQAAKETTEEVDELTFWERE